MAAASTAAKSRPGAGWGLAVGKDAKNPPLDDVKVRQAVEWAVDKNAMNQTVWNGVFKPACSPLTPNVLGYDAKMCDKYKYDASRAAALLDQAEWRMNATTGGREKGGQPPKARLYIRAD